MMRVLRTGLAALALFLAGDPLAAQETPKRIDQGKSDAKLKGYTTPEGFKLELVPTPPLKNPVDLAFDRDGTPFVLEHAVGKTVLRSDAVTITYKDGATRKINVAARPGADTLRKLEATKADGPWDRADPQTSGEGIDTFLAHGTWRYVATPGQLERVRIPQGKQAAPPQVLVRGFAHVPHGVTGLCIGPDNWLYVAVGAGDHHLQGSDGTRVFVLGTGAILRCKPDGTGLHVVARGLARPTAPTWDSVGHPFIADREERGGRVLHLLEGSDYGYALAGGRVSPVPEAVRKELFEALPPHAPSMLRAAGSAPTAVLAPIEARWPGHYRARLLVADPARQAVTTLSLDAEGATFVVEKSLDLLVSEDRAFIPAALRVGPDGAVYILDARPEGRLLRLTWEGHGPDEALPPRPPDTWAKLLRASEEDLLAALGTPEAADRRLAADELAQRGNKQVPALLKLVQNREEPLLARIAAFSAALAGWDRDVYAACLDLLSNPESDLRRLAAQALFLAAPARDADTQTILLKSLNDADLTVRRAVVLTMGRLGADGAADALVSALLFDDSRDPAFRQGIVAAIELLGKVGIDRLLSVGDSGVDAEISRIVQTFTALSSRPAAEALPRLLVNPHLNERQRATLLRTVPRYRLEPALDLDPIAGHFEAMPEEANVVKFAALEALTLSNGPATGPRLAAWLPTLLKEKDASLRLAALKTFDRVKPMKAVPVLETLVANAETSLEERAAGLRAMALVDLPSARTAGRALPAEIRSRVVAELKKHADATDLVRELDR